jgi:Right handed beta helix region
MQYSLTRILLVCLFVLYFCFSSIGQTIYVSPNGDDKNPGTKQNPVASFAAAQILARKIPRDQSSAVIFASGTYYLPEPIHFSDEDSKINGATVTYSADMEGQAVISGGSLLKLKWEPFRNGIFIASVPDNTIIDQLYINGIRQRMARFPNAVRGKNVFDTWELNHNATPDSTNNPLTPARIALWENPTGGYIHAMHSALWGDMHWIITGKNEDGTINYQGGWQNNRPSTMHPVYRMVENIFEELDAPGEWFYNSTEGKLYYIPEPTTDLKKANVEIVRLRELVEFRGSEIKPVRSINLKGFVFRHTARTFMDNKEPLLRSDWTVYRGGAVIYNGAENCTISDCEFDQVGGNTIFINNYNRRITIRGCYIHGSGANGIAFVGDPSTVRNPIFTYGPQDYQKIDHTPGPKGNNFPEDCLVEDCLITLTGRDEKQTAPVHISMSHKIRVNHCSIYDVPRAGININEGTFGGHIIENCDVFNTVLETGDHGSFNSWGRDRYWTPDVKETVAAVLNDSALSSLDMLDPNIIRNNRWRCDHGWDIDLDDGSSHYQITNNLLLNGGLKMREGYDRKATNNIIINNGLHPHVWYNNSGDIFKNNIVFLAYQPAIMNATIADDGIWGKELDFNFYVADKEVMTRYARNGCDKNSSFGNPLFVDAHKGDFSISINSPVIDIGFNNFSMDQFGVTKPSLKALAKTPQIPEIKITSTYAQVPKSIFTWMDIPLNEPTGNEMSAFGVRFNSGGVALVQVPKNSLGAKLGFRTGDLIQEINGFKIKTIQDFKDFIQDKNKVSNKHTFILVRNQTRISVALNQPLIQILQLK